MFSLVHPFFLAPFGFPKKTSWGTPFSPSCSQPPLPPGAFLSETQKNKGKKKPIFARFQKRTQKETEVKPEREKKANRNWKLEQKERRLASPTKENPFRTTRE